MEAKGPFRVNAPNVISENIDGEVVIINLDSGTYYSTTGSGAVAWDLVTAGHAVDRIVRAFQAAHPDEVGIDVAINAFVRDLVSEQLVRPLTDGESAAGEAPELASNGSFARPTLNAYEDMKDMLLLDPIHDVDEAGWPTPRPGDEARPAKTE